MIDATHVLEHQTNVIKLRSFFNLSHVFLRFGPNFDRVAGALNIKPREGRLQTPD